MFENAVRTAKQLADDKQTAVKDITARYMQEALMRKSLYNQLQELRGNIRYAATPSPSLALPACVTPASRMASAACCIVVSSMWT